MISEINDHASLVVDWLWTVSWQCAILGGVVYLITSLMKGMPSWVRYTLWLLIPLRLMIPPGVAIPFNAGEISQSVYKTLFAEATSAEVIDEGISITGFDIEQGVEYATYSAAQANVGTTWSFDLIIVSLWALGVFIALSIVLSQFMQISRVLKTSTVPHDDLGELFRGLCREHGLKSKIQLKVTAHDTSPFVFGVFRPVVVIPEQLLERLHREELEAVLHHELIHVKKMDQWVNMVVICISVIFYFHPLVWLANRMIREERERRCDELVVRDRGVTKDTYTSALMKVMNFHTERIGFVMSTMADGRSAKRLKSILSPGETKRSSGVVGCLIILCCSLLFLTLEAREVEEEVSEEVMLATEIEQEVDEESQEPTQLGVSSFSVLPKEENLSEEQKLQFFRNVKYVVETLLYSASGKANAEANGRKLLANESTFQMIIIDYQDNIDKVQEYISQLKLSSAADVQRMTKVYFLNYQGAESVVQTLRKQFREDTRAGRFLVFPITDQNGLRVNYSSSFDIVKVEKFMSEYDHPNYTVDLELNPLYLTTMSSRDEAEIREKLRKSEVTFDSVKRWEKEKNLNIVQSPRITIIAGESAEYHFGMGSMIEVRRGKKTSNELEDRLRVEVSTQMPSSGHIKASGRIVSISGTKEVETLFPITLFENRDDTGLIKIGYTSAFSGKTEYLLIQGSYR